MSTLTIKKFENFLGARGNHNQNIFFEKSTIEHYENFIKK